jgi:hypothetical protein
VTDMLVVDVDSNGTLDIVAANNSNVSLYLDLGVP